MIDNKKIEEAARYYCNNRYPASQDAPFIAEGFRLGAKWTVNELLKDLWHPAKEAPDLYEWIIAEWYDSDEKEYKYETDFDTPSVNWKDYVKRNNITKWCYIKDIKD